MKIGKWMLIAAAVALAGVYVVCFTGWLKPRVIQISYTFADTGKRPGPRVVAGNADTKLLTFGLDGSYKLTEVKVVPLAGWQTNPAVLPLWHLVSDSNSVPRKSFPYGLLISGMKPAVGREWPRPLEPGVTYRIFVSAGSVKGSRDFTAMPKSAAGH